MTDKQEKILQAALELFANEGYNATSTNRIAKHAGVSEGLIFRHFTNKEGLLKAIVQKAEKKVKEVFADIVFETDPRQVILKMLSFTDYVSSDKEEADFWKLQYKIKWEIETYNDKKMEPVEMALGTAFDKLGYDEPKLEAKLLLVLLDGLATRYFLQEDFDRMAMIDFLKRRYLK
jgi:AcrR family transcriptional regulator